VCVNITYVWHLHRQNKRREGASSAGFHVHEACNAAVKGKRAVVLAKWLIETFGHDALSSGTGVIDVAGSLPLQHQHMKLQVENRV
jgi:hypothetical protein